VPENLLDDLGLVLLDEGDDAHRRTTLGTADWLRYDYPPLADESVPRRLGDNDLRRSVVLVLDPV